MANVKISALPSWTGSSADLRWFVMNNSGETETFKFSGYTSPFRYVNGTLKNTVYDGTYTNNTITSSGTDNIILNGNGNTISGSGIRSSIIGGPGNTLTNSDSTILASDTSTNSGIQCAIVASQASYIAPTYRGFIAAAYDCRINGGVVSAVIGGYQNYVNTSGYATILNGYNNNVGGGNFNQVLNGDSNTIGYSTSNVTILGGQGNTIIRATNSSIINSKTSTQNVGNTYNTDTVTMIACENTDITNCNNIAVLAVSGRTIPSAAANTTYVDKLSIFGNTTYEATTFNDSGNCDIDIFNMSHVIINATGGTYNLNIIPTPSQEGTPELTLLIYYASTGATINFASGGNTQWRWGNGAGAPSFTANTRSIIKMAAWAGNDLWEISRSMNMV